MSILAKNDFLTSSCWSADHNLALHARELNLEYFSFCQILIAAVALSVIQRVPQVDIATHHVQS